MLTGQYQRSLDSKARLTLPAPHRKGIGADSVVLMRRKDALYGYSQEAFEAWIDSLELNPRKKEDMEMFRLITAGATTVDIDSAGRIALGKIDETDPQGRTKLQLEGNVMVVGAGDHFEIWNQEKWTELFCQDDPADRLEALLFGE